MISRRSVWTAGLALIAAVGLVLQTMPVNAAPSPEKDPGLTSAINPDQPYGGHAVKPASGKSSKSADGDKWGKATKDTEIMDGLFRIHKGKKTWYLQINPEQFDQQYILALTIGRGIGSKFLLGGLTLNENMVHMSRVGDQILFYKDDLRFRATGDSALMKAIDLSYAPSVVHVFKIEAEREDTVLVDLKDFIISDYADIAEGWKQVLGGKPSIDTKKSTLGSLKVFEGNIEMEANLILTPGDREKARVRTVADDRYVPLTIHYSLMRLPEPGFVPRLLDDRVGYFSTSHKDFARDDFESYKVHFANHWRLEKKNPAARISEPVKPITYYLENTIPEKWRPYIRQGVEEWNKAFEEAGFKNAIVVLDQPEDDPDFDAADIRYSTIRWISSSEQSFGAIGPSRIDPRTGEIFDADILVEAGWILGFKNQYRRWLGPETVQEALDGITTADLERGFSSNFCQAGKVAFDGGNIMNLAMLAEGQMPPGSPVPDEFIGQTLVWLTLHEVGHTLGLRHNFQSSVAVPYEKLDDLSYISQHGLLGSVMDYTTAQLRSFNRSDHIYYTQTVGPYDRWAIRYGYTPTVAASPFDERDFLAAIAEESAQPGLNYGTDEDTYPRDALDPRNNIFDLGDDPLAFGMDRAEFVSAIWRNPRFEERVLAPGVGYQTLRYSISALMFQYARALSHGLKYLGGQQVSRAHYGDPGAPDPFTPIPADEQRKALAFITDNALSPNSFDVHQSLLNKMMANRNWDWEVNLFANRIDYPYYTIVLSLQEGIVARMLDPSRIARLREAENRQPNPLTLSEYFNELTGAIWGEFGIGSSGAYARKNPAETMAATNSNGTRRDLQRFYVDGLVGWVVNPAKIGTDDGRALARLHLQRIDDACERSLETGNKSDVLQAHLMETRARIEAAFDADMTLGG